MDSTTSELRDAHDSLAAFYRARLADHLQRSPAERVMLDLFCELTRAVGDEVGDIGCGTGRITPYLVSRGLRPRGVDLSPEMVRVAREDHPGVAFEVGDLRALPFADGELAGVVCWYSLIFLAPDDRAVAFGELARVVRPGGYFVTASQIGDGTHQRRGRGTGLDIEFSAYWLSAGEMEQRAADAGFTTVFRGSRPPEGEDRTPAQYLLCRRV